MVKTTVFIYSMIENLIILISFIFSLFQMKKIRANNYLKLFPIYTFISVIVDLLWYLQRSLGIFSVNLFILFEFIIFYSFYWKVLNTNNDHKILRTLIGSYCILLFIMIWMYHEKYHVPWPSLFIKRVFVEIIAMSNIILVLPTIMYYKSLFALPVKNLKKEPEFLIMSGILFGFVLAIPIDTMYLFISSYDKNLFSELYVLNALGYIIMHLFIIKSYLTLK